MTQLSWPCGTCLFTPAIAVLLVLLGSRTPAPAQQLVTRLSPESAGSAAEVSIAINPFNIDNIVAGCIMGGYPDSEAPNFSFVSRDGGKTFATVPVPNPNARSQGDDVLLFSGDGLCVHGMISFAGLWEDHPAKAANGIAISRSSDQGLTWSDPVYAADHLNTKSPMEDKPWLVFDRNRRSPNFGHLYCAWTRFDVYGSEDPQDTTQIMFARSIDGGASFQPVIRISDQGGDCRDDDNTVEGAVPAIGPDGTVYVVWGGPRGMELDKSTDGGVTFGKDRVISDMPGGWASEVAGVSRHNGMPVTAVDHSHGSTRGTLYVNWIDERNGDKDVFLIHSRDAGETWSQPVRVNADPLKNGRDQFFTWLSIDPSDGSVNIVYYDRGETEGTQTRLTLARSLDGETFQHFPLDVPKFDCSADAFFGDYLGIDAMQGRVATAFMHFVDGGKLAVSSAILDFKPGTCELAELGHRMAGQPDRMTVQHILIGFEGSVPEKDIPRTVDESRKLAQDLLARAKAGEDFDALVKEYTNDQYPGIYQMSNLNILPDMAPEATEEKLFPRGGMVRAFGDVSFSLDVGEIGMTEYELATSKYGWHIIKRIK